MTKHHRPTLRRSEGLSLIELMIGLTIGMIILAAVTALFATSSQSRNELEKSTRQLENGRHAIEMLREEIELAGFYGDFMPTVSTVWTTPDPCTLALNQMGFAATIPHNLPTGLFGYENGAAITANCIASLPNRNINSDILVVRRVSTATTAAASAVAGEHYLQVSNCSGTPNEAAFVLAKQAASFTLHGVRPAGTPPSCLNGDINPVRRYVVRIYYIADCNVCSPSDNIPTLKMAERVAGNAACAANAGDPCGSFNTLPVAEGIENMQIEYAVDADGDGTPESYQTASTIANWADVVGAKAFLLARNAEPTTGYADTKTYVLNSSGDPTTGLTPGGNFRRSAFSVAIRANNIAGRRQP